MLCAPGRERVAIEQPPFETIARAFEQTAQGPVYRRKGGYEFPRSRLDRDASSFREAGQRLETDGAVAYHLRAIQRLQTQPMQGRINRAHQTRHFAPTHAGDVGGGRRHGDRRARRVGASGEEDRAARSRARQDHLDQRADQGAGRRASAARSGPAEGPLWWKEGGYLLFTRHPQQPAHEIHAGAGRHRRPGADQPRQRADPRSAGPAALRASTIPGG